jgi:hypothetical protein
MLTPRRAWVRRGKRSRHDDCRVGAAAGHFRGITLSGMTRCHPRVVPSSPDGPCPYMGLGFGFALAHADLLFAAFWRCQ